MSSQHRARATVRSSRLLIIGVVSITLLALPACQTTRAGRRCAGNGAAQDATHILVCRNGRWTRLMTKADGLRLLAEIQRRRAAEVGGITQTRPDPTPTTAAPTPPPPPPATTTAPPTTTPPTTTTPPPPTTTTTTSTPPTTTTSTTTTSTPPTTTTTTTTTSTPPTTTTTTTTPPTAGDLDAAFGSAGFVDLNLGLQGGGTLAAAPLPSGGTLVLVVTNIDGLTGAGTLQLRRLSANGTPDASWANPTVVSTTVCGPGYCGVAVDSDGRAYVWKQNFSLGAVSTQLTRFTTAGAIDTSYGTSGTVSVPGSSKVAVAGNGSAAAVSGSGTMTASLVRISSAGATTPGSNGAATSPNDVRFDEFNRLVVLRSPNGPTGELQRYAAGSTALDTTFGTNGSISVPAQYGSRLLVDGSSRPYVTTGRSVRRYSSAGIADSTYGSSGVATVPASDAFATLIDVTVTSGGKVSGITNIQSTTSPSAEVGLLNSGGSADSTFGGGDGIATIAGVAFSNASNYFGDLAVGSRIIVASGTGFIGLADTIVTDPILGSVKADGLFKLTASGASDAGFGSAGTVTLRTANIRFSAREFHPGPGGSVYVTLQPPRGGPGGNTAAVVVRLTPSGALDTSFSGDGILVDASADNVTVDTNGRPLFYSTVTNSTFSFGGDGSVTRTLRRFTTAGAPDPSFDGDGVLQWPALNPPSGTPQWCTALLQPVGDDGVVVVYGPAGPGCSTTGMDKVSAGGTLQQNWGTGLAAVASGQPIVATDAGPGSTLLVLVAGGFSFPGNSRVIRLAGNGTVDTAYGSGGSIEVMTGSSMFTAVSDGSILVSASATGVSFGPIAVRRYLANGTLVTNTGGFDASGVLSITGLASIDATAQRFAIATESPAGAAVSVFRPDGNLDTAFPRAGDDGTAALGSSSRPGVVGIVSSRVYAATNPSGSSALRISRTVGTVP